MAKTSKNNLGLVHNIALGPKSWTIETGSYAGQVVPIDLNSAYTPSGPNNSSYFNSTVSQGVVSYNENYLDLSGAPFSLAESLSVGNSNYFWQAIAEEQSILGWNVLKRADGSTGATWSAAVVPAQVAFGATSLVVANGSITGVKITLATFMLAQGYVGSQPFRAGLEHEMIHGFGLGHTCSWVSIMNPSNGDCNNTSSFTPTATDVAYLELRQKALGAQRQVGSGGLWFGLPYSHQGQRIRELGLPAQAFRINGLVQPSPIS